jgi:hypothetical protein
LQSDNTAPQSPSGVGQIRYPDGYGDGSEPVVFNGWADGGSSEQYSKIYYSIWLRTVGPTFESHPVGNKMGFIGSGRETSHVGNQSYFILKGGGITSQMSLEFHQQNIPGGQDFDPNVNDAPFTCGEWHHWELVAEINDVGAANGTLKIWQDGVLMFDYDNVTWRGGSQTNMFWALHFAPTWGGNVGATKTRDDFVQIDHIYLSGVR